MDIQPTVRRRRTHTESFKQAVINACQAPGASVAGVALTHGVNANQVRRWMRERGVVLPSRLPLPMVDAAPAFVPVALPPVRSETGPIVIEVRRGTTAIHVEWPLQAADACAAWLRSWLR
ncbi:MAG: transposase [Chitinivorax sp.]